jgi:signal transduction histidine kinase/DNA-binding response OmpR family regulator
MTPKKLFKILIVDDHPNTAAMMARALHQISNKVEVISATSGKEALTRVQEGAPDIVVTDMIMPEMTGLELIEQLHNHPAGRPTFTFLMTAYDVPGLKVTARRLQIKDVLVKPVSPERICQIINQAIDEMGQAKPTRPSTASQKAFNILIADDQPDNLLLLARYLSNEGYAYITAKNGLETLEKVRSEIPDLVLLDVNMPYKDGFTVLKEIRADPSIRHIPVIILTAARLDPTEVQSGLNMGADDYITKPFDRRELFARIRTKLRVKEAEDVIRRQNRELNLLPEIGKELSARLNIEELATILLKRTVETLGAMYGHILIFSPRGSYQQTYHLTSSAPASPLSLPSGLIERLKDTRQGLLFDDIQKDSGWGILTGDPARAAVIVPMFGRYSLLGVLVLTNEQTGYFTLDHLLLLQAITSQASIAVENAQLYDRMSQEQQRLSAVLQSAAEAILMLDGEGRLLLVNPAGQKLFTDYEAKIGQHLASGAGYDSFLQLLEQARLFNASFSGEVVWPDKRVFSAAMTPVREGGMVVVLHDITHFKQLEKVKNEFIATASHDLRNPLTTIKGYSVLVQQAGPLTENQLDFVKRIRHAGEHMTELVENMLDLAKMDLGAEQKQEIFDLSAELFKLKDEFQPQAATKGQTLELEQVEANSTVRGDALKIRQVLRNLIGNAIKYTPEAGMITLSLTHAADMVNVRVKDSGYGIPAADLPHIFNRFYRVRNNGHDDIEGNGLGLAIVKAIAEGHGGEVSVESEVGKGTCFNFMLPFAQAAIADLNPTKEL